MKLTLAGVLLILPTACTGSEPVDPEPLPEVLTEQQLQAMSTDQIRAMGIGTFGWSPPEVLERWPRDELIELFLESQKCSGENSPTQPPRNLARYEWTHGAEELDILEAVYRYQFENNPITMDAESLDRLDYLFVDLDGEDPPAQLVERFADHLPAVQPVSAAKSEWGDVSHRIHGGEGRIFSIERIRRIAAGTVDVDGGYSGGCATGNTYRVKHRDGSWEVVCDAMWWIS